MSKPAEIESNQRFAYNSPTRSPAVCLTPPGWNPPPIYPICLHAGESWTAFPIERYDLLMREGCIPIPPTYTYTCQPRLPFRRLLGLLFLLQPGSARPCPATLDAHVFGRSQQGRAFGTKTWCKTMRLFSCGRGFIGLLDLSHPHRSAQVGDATDLPDGLLRELFCIGHLFHKRLA